ncbi:hypothetical protein BC332_03573 [Capsicum chinense]|nr:hypothetical protein BC332_03573 [Capsicum chinense]
MERIFSHRAGAFFIDGPGGTRKTFLCRALLATIRLKGYIAFATTTSGVAASILLDGRTAYSRFKISINVDDTFSCNISKQSALACLIRDAKLIIWDEIFTVVEQIKEDNTDDPPLPAPTRLNTISLANLEQQPRHVEFDVLTVVVSCGSVKFAGIHENKCRQIVIMDAKCHFQVQITDGSGSTTATLLGEIGENLLSIRAEQIYETINIKDALHLPTSSASLDVGENSKRELDNASSPDEPKKSTIGRTSSRKRQQLKRTTPSKKNVSSSKREGIEPITPAKIK